MTALELQEKLQSEDPTRVYKVEFLEINEFNEDDLSKAAKISEDELEQNKVRNPTKTVYTASVHYTINNIPFNISTPHYVESEEVAIERLIEMINQNLSFI